MGRWVLVQCRPVGIDATGPFGASSELKGLSGQVVVFIDCLASLYVGNPVLRLEDFLCQSVLCTFSEAWLPWQCDQMCVDG